MTKAIPRCPRWKSQELKETHDTVVFHPNKKCVRVFVTRMHCSSCGASSTTGDQHKENLMKLSARRSEYKRHLLGEDYVSVRKRYGLTQIAAAKIFGKGIISFSRYESETSYPDLTTRLLIELAIDLPEVLKALADKAKVEIPLWSPLNE